MKKNRKIIVFICVLLFATVMNKIYDKKNEIGTNEYLSTRNEERSMVSCTNVNYTDDSMSLDLRSLMVGGPFLT